MIGTEADALSSSYAEGRRAGGLITPARLIRDAFICGWHRGNRGVKEDPVKVALETWPDEEPKRWRCRAHSFVTEDREFAWHAKPVSGEYCGAGSEPVEETP